MNYSPGIRDAEYKSSAIRLIDLVSRHGGKICGSSVIWFLRTLYPGKNHKYFQTVVNDGVKSHTFIRGLDISVKNKAHRIKLIEKLNKVGSLTDDDYMYNGLIFKLFIYLHVDIPLIPFATQNMWMETYPDLKFGMFQTEQEICCEFHIANIIRNCSLIFNYWDNLNSLPGHTKSGDLIVSKDSADGNFFTHLSRVIGGRDVALVNYFDININSNPIYEEGDICSICLDELSIRPIFTTECNHHFHIGCISQYLYNYYLHIFAHSENQKAYRVLEQCKCPMCKSKCLEISTLYDNKLDSLDMLKSIFLIK